MALQVLEDLLLVLFLRMRFELVDLLQDAVFLLLQFVDLSEVSELAADLETNGVDVLAVVVFFFGEFEFLVDLLAVLFAALSYWF